MSKIAFLNLNVFNVIVTCAPFPTSQDRDPQKVA